MSAPVQEMCQFPGCAAPASFGFSPPGSPGLKHGPTVHLCAAHREHGDSMLQARITELGRERAAEISSRARRDEGLLL